ncbi:MAG TPA: hypothetical protein VGH80_12340 [Xanthomonadaceae bacterium]|jgi:hypothetical protein
MSVFAQNQQLERQLAGTLASGILAAGGVLKEAFTVEQAADQSIAVFNAVLAALQKSTRDQRTQT